MLGGIWYFLFCPFRGLGKRGVVVFQRSFFSFLSFFPLIHRTHNHHIRKRVHSSLPKKMKLCGLLVLCLAYAYILTIVVEASTQRHQTTQDFDVLPDSRDSPISTTTFS